MASEDDVAAGLIYWVNSLNIADEISFPDELATGDVLWKLLHNVDAVAFTGPLPETPAQIHDDDQQSWVPRWTNLKHVYDALSIFLIESCNQHLPIFTSPGGQKVNPDLRAIAQHGSVPDVVIVLKLCVVAATSCENNGTFLEPMIHLPGNVQHVLMETITESESHRTATQDAGVDEVQPQDYAADQDADDSLVQARSTRSNEGEHAVTGSASEFAHEERLATVIADQQRTVQQYRELQRHVDELNARYGSLLEKYERSQDELNGANDRLTAVLSGRGGEKSSDAQKEAVIANLEARVAEYEGDIEGLRKSNEMLKIKAEKVQKLQDDFDEIKIERDNLSRKANTADKYKQKLEATHDMEKENASLKQKLASLQTQLRQSDSRTATSGDLSREVEEYRRLLPAIEQERHEVNEMKKRLEFDYQILQARCQETEEQLRSSRQEVEDLQGQLREYGTELEVGEADRTAHGGVREDGAESLDRVLQADDEAFAAVEARLAEALLKGNGSSTPPNEDGEGVSEDELRAIMSAMRAQMQAGTAQERESGLKMQKKMVIMLERTRTRNLDLMDQNKKHLDLIQELQKRPEEPVQPVREPRPEEELEQQIEEQETMISNLKREIRLISSAWYEQNQRLSTLGAGSGSGAVALMRLKGGHGLEEPRSFLGKQRRLVEQVMVGQRVGH